MASIDGTPTHAPATRAARGRVSGAAIATTVMVTLLLGGCGGGQPERAPGETRSPAATTAPGPAPTAPPPTTTPKQSTPPAGAPPAIDAAGLAAGEALYRTNCGMCHGPSGAGDGAMASMLNPPPRALIDEPWRFIEADSPMAERAGLEGVIRNGIATSGMPPYGSSMSDEQIGQVAAYVLRLRGAGTGS